MDYLDVLLLQAELTSNNVVITMLTLQEFGWVLNLQKFVLPPTQCLEYFGLILDSTKVFLPLDWLFRLQCACCCPASGRLCLQVLVLMVSTFFEAVPYAQFQTLVLQKEILSKWERSPTSLDNQILLTKALLLWWLQFPALWVRK